MRILLLLAACSPRPKDVPDPGDAPGTIEPTVEDTDAEVADTTDTSDTAADVDDTGVPGALYWISADAGSTMSCGLVSDGTVRCWGADECIPTAPGRDETFTEISVGGWAGCGLRPDGSVRCWCCDLYGLWNDICSETPPGAFDRVSVGLDTACAQDAEGRMTCWGVDWYEPYEELPVAPLIDYAMESSYNAGLLADGAVVWWGMGTNWGDDLPPDVPFTAIGLGRRHACALDAAGQAYCWGDDYNLRPFPPAPAGTFASLASFSSATCFLDLDGYATCVFGEDLLAMELWDEQLPTVQFTQIGLGEWNGCGVDVTGQAWCWGGDPSYMPWLRVPELEDPTP